MAITNVLESWRGGESQRGESRDKAVRNWTVWVEGGSPSAEIAVEAREIPRVGDVHPKNERLRCTRIEATTMTPRMYAVRAEYSSPERMAAEGGVDSYPTGTTPLDQPPEIQWGLTVETEAIDVAYDDDNKLTVPVVNTAGQPLEPAIEREFRDRTLSFTRNEARFDSVLADEYNDVVSTDVFFGRPAGTARCLGITATLVIEAGWTYWRNRYDFIFRKDGWLRRKLNVGTVEKLGDGKIRAIRDAEGNPVNEPVPLTLGGRKRDWRENIIPGQSGTVLIGGKSVAYETGKDVMWLKFKVFETRPFARLGIP